VRERSDRLFGRDFVLLWQGQLVSQLGNQAFLVATMSWTLDRTGSPPLMGLMLLVSTLPAVVFGPLAGAIADRHSRKALIVAADLLRGIGHLALAAVLTAAPGATGLIVSVLLGLGFASGVLGALLTPALGATLPELVPAHRLAAANSLHHMSSQMATLVGQGLGGLAYASLGATGLVLFDAITFLLSAACASFTHLPERTCEAGALRERATDYVRDVRKGIAWLWSRPSLRSLVLAFTTVNFLFTPVFVLLPVYVKDSLGRGPEWYGFLLGGASAGALAGAAAATLPLAARAHPRSLVLGIGACTAMLGLTRSCGLALILMLGIGLCSGLLNVRVMTGLQSSTPDELRARVLAVTVALAGAAVPAGLGLGGLLGGVARPALAAVIVGCGAGIVIVARGFFSTGEGRRSLGGSAN
jgi:MFS family permease